MKLWTSASGVSKTCSRARSSNMIVDVEGTPQQVARTTDDVRAIRQDCKTCDQWQAQLLHSLCLSGWTLQMLTWIPAADPMHWFELLTSERQQRWRHFDSSFEVNSHAAIAALEQCGTDRERWLLLLLRTLEQRGWTRTMLSEALGIPRTNIIRRLDGAAS